MSPASLGIASVDWHALADRRLLRRLGHDLVGCSRHADAGRQGMELLVFRIAEHETIVGVPQHERFGDVLDCILEAKLSFLIELVGDLLRGHVDGDADEVGGFFCGRI